MYSVGAEKAACLSRRRGQALTELAILAPWIFGLFICAADFGFCSVAAIGVQNAARAAAIYASSSPAAASDSLSACTVVRQELQSLPNYIDSNAACSSAPLQVTAQSLVSGVDGGPAARVTVTYQTIPLIYVPLLFSGPFTIVKVVDMPLRAN
jgi:Flp pilus assembly protein TadG